MEIQECCIHSWSCVWCISSKGWDFGNISSTSQSVALVFFSVTMTLRRAVLPALQKDSGQSRPWPESSLSHNKDIIIAERNERVMTIPSTRKETKFQKQPPSIECTFSFESWARSRISRGSPKDGFMCSGNSSCFLAFIACIRKFHVTPESIAFNNLRKQRGKTATSWVKFLPSADHTGDNCGLRTEWGYTQLEAPECIRNFPWKLGSRIKCPWRHVGSDSKQCSFKFFLGHC